MEGRCTKMQLPDDLYAIAGKHPRRDRLKPDQRIRTQPQMFLSEMT
jgi:hypothetical protein